MADEDVGANRQLDEGLVLMIRDDCRAWTEGLSKVDPKADIETKLSYLCSKVAGEMKNISLARNVVAYSLRGLSPANVPVRHAAELTKNEPVYDQVRRVAPRRKQIIREELDMMLKAVTVASDTSAWSCPVMVATEGTASLAFV